jgi:hypothetical protein
MFRNGGASFLLLMIALIIVSGMAFKDGIDRIRGGAGAEGLENMQKQNFNLTPGTFPATLDSLLLSPEYPTPGTIMNVPATAIGVDAAASGHATTILGAEYPTPTNNPRYAASPDNDTCMPMTMCNSFYGMRNERPKPAPAAIPLSDPRRRVNYYATE